VRGSLRRQQKFKPGGTLGKGHCGPNFERSSRLTPTKSGGIKLISQSESRGHLEKGGKEESASGHSRKEAAERGRCQTSLASRSRRGDLTEKGEEKDIHQPGYDGKEAHNRRVQRDNE